MHELIVSGHFLKPVGLFWPWFLSQRLVFLDQVPDYTIGVFRSRPRWSTPQVVFVWPRVSGNPLAFDLHEVIAVAESNVLGSIHNSDTLPFTADQLLRIRGMYWYHLLHEGRPYHLLVATTHAPEKHDTMSRMAFLPIPLLSFAQRKQLQKTSPYHTVIYEDFQAGYASIGIVIPSEYEDVMVPIGLNQAISIQSNSSIDIISVQ